MDNGDGENWALALLLEYNPVTRAWRMKIGSGIPGDSLVGQMELIKIRLAAICDMRQSQEEAKHRIVIPQGGFPPFRS